MSNVPLILPTPTSSAETIHAVELAYHTYVIQQVQTIPQLQAQMQQLQNQVLAIGGARDSWMGHLTERYQLAGGDQINGSGQIIRATPPEGDPPPEPGA